MVFKAKCYIYLHLQLGFLQREALVTWYSMNVDHRYGPAAIPCEVSQRRIPSEYMLYTGAFIASQAE